MLKLLYRIFLLFILVTSTMVLYEKNTYAYHTLKQIDPLPHTQALINQDKYRDAYVYLTYFMQFDYVKQNPKARDMLTMITKKRNSIAYQSEKIIQGIKQGTSDELSGQIASIGSDFFVVGDVRDLVLQGKHYLNH